MQTLNTFPKYLKRNYEIWGDDKVATRKKDLGIWREYTWKEYYEIVKGITLGLVSIGLQPEAKVAIIGDTEPEWYWAEIAAQAASGIPVGLYTDAQNAEVTHFINHFHCEYIFANDQEQVDKVLAIKNDVPRLKKAIYWDDKGLKHYDDPFLVSWQGLRRLGDEYEKKNPGIFEKMIDDLQKDNVCYIAPTSGTTGEYSKGAIHTHETYINAFLALDKIAPLNENDRYIGILPAAVTWEQLMVLGGGLIKGVVSHFPENPETAQEDMRDISPSSMLYAGTLWDSLASLVQAKITEANFAYRFLYNLAMKIGYKRSELIRAGSLKRLSWEILYGIAYVSLLRPLRDNIGLLSAKNAFSSATLLSPESIKFFRAMGVNIRQGYGSMEMNIACSHPSIKEIKSDTVGKPLPGAEVKISKAKDSEILFKSPFCCKGYYNDPEKTAEAFTKDGYFRTGDSGSLDEDGHIVYYDRICDLSQLTGGLKYSPIYIESKLRFSPAVKTAMAVGHGLDYVSAIINMDFDFVGRWAERNHVAYTTFADLSQKGKVGDLFRREIEKINKTIPDHAIIKKFILLHKELDPDEAELTRTWKVRRKFVSERYKDLINALYGGETSITLDSEVRYRDGRRANTSTQILIRTM